MDTELARTFMMVVSAGNFISAAERLHVTQSTVSARIRLLEEQLGCSLFIRNKAGTTLTASGKQFQKHAATLVRTVERARQDVGIPRRFRASLTVGARVGLWDRLLVEWLAWMADRLPDTSVRAEIGFEDDLMFGLVEGRIDIRGQWIVVGAQDVERTQQVQAVVGVGDLPQQRYRRRVRWFRGVRGTGQQHRRGEARQQPCPGQDPHAHECGDLRYAFSPAVIDRSRRFSGGGNGHVANGVNAQGGL